MPGYGMPLILTLFEYESPRRYFAEVWNMFQEQDFLSLSMATSKLQGTIIKICSEKPRWLPNRQHITS